MSELVAKLRELLKEASTGPWKAATKKEFGQNWVICTSLGESAIDQEEYHVCTDGVHCSEFDGDAKTDAEFIAAARNALPTLLELLDSQRREIAELGEVNARHAKIFEGLSAIGVEAANATTVNHESRIVSLGVKLTNVRAEAAEKLLSAERERVRWIPVDKELPEQMKSVLLAIPSEWEQKGPGREGVLWNFEVGWLESGEDSEMWFGTESESYDFENVTHWQLLPEAPKPVKESR